MSSEPDHTAVLEPDYQASLEFLQRWLPRGPWILTAIIPDRPKKRQATFTETFGQADVSKRLPEWLAEHGTRLKRNIYFTVNQCARALTSKPSRENIAAMSWLHVDLDPRVGEDITSERARILGLLQNLEPLGIPHPTALVFSGGGYQGFWRLKVPVLLDGSAAEYEEAKRYNKQLELVLGGDNCHNVDRIMRLPGTVNRPDARKRAKGRVEALAEVIEFNDSLHDIARFTKAPEVQSASARFSGRTIEVSGNVARYSSVDEIEELRDKRFNQCRIVIVQGLDPDDPDKFKGSRSEWLFFVCCEMVRAGCSDDVIYSVITDPDFGISASVLDKGSGIEEYAVRQIERARAEANDTELAELNARHTIAIMGGVVRVLTTSMEEVPATGIVAPKTTPTAPAGMALFYANRRKEWLDEKNELRSMPLWTWWTQQRWSNRASGVVFAPEREVEPGTFNLWHGFAVPPAEGNCQPFLDFVHRRIACGRDDVREYILDWLALTVQRPWEPIGTALVLYSRMTGTGKNAFVDLSLGLILGHSALYVTDGKHLFGQFSGHLATTVALHLGEAATAEAVEAERLMKALVTDRTRMSERKGIDGVPVANCLHVVMSSNQDWILRLAPEDRRYCVVDVCEERMPREEYASLREHMLSGGAAALHALLAARDLSGFDVVKDRPAGGVAELRQKAHSVEGLDAAWFDFLQSGELPGFCAAREDGSVWVPTTDLLDYLNLSRRPRKQWGPNLLRNLLKGPQENHRGAGMGFEKEGQVDPGKGPWGYVIPPLAEARARWDARRFTFTWDDDGEAGWIVRVMPYPEELR